MESGPVGERRLKNQVLFLSVYCICRLNLATLYYCMFDRMKLFNNSAPLWRPVAFCIAVVRDIFGGVIMTYMRVFVVVVVVD